MRRTSSSPFENRSERAARLLLLGALLAASGCEATLAYDHDDAGPGGDAGLGEDAGTTPDDAAAPDEPDAGVPVIDAGPPPVADAGPSTADCPRVRVITVGLSLNVRDAPRLDSEIVGSLAEGALAEVVSAATGDTVDGIDTWYEVNAPRGFVSGRWAECTTDEPPTRPDGYLLPLACGRSARVSQGNESGFSHEGYSRYAFDFALPHGTTLHAMADGVVAKVNDDTQPGDPCYDGGGRECIDAANLVWVRHGDGTVTSYAHLSAVSVRVGQRVTSGTAVGRSGSTGYSTGPHAHIARQQDCRYAGCQSVPLRFADVPGDGVPETGDTVTSGNCP